MCLPWGAFTSNYSRSPETNPSNISIISDVYGETKAASIQRTRAIGITSTLLANSYFFFSVEYQ